MPQFEVGFLSVVFAAVFVALFSLKFLFRKVAAWSTREEQPKDRVGFFVLVFAVFGFVLGSFAQPLWNLGVACQRSGQPLGICFFKIPK